LSKQNFTGKHIIIDPGQRQGGKYGEWDGIGLINLEKAGLMKKVIKQVEFYSE
jgi:hypothetical protein